MTVLVSEAVRLDRDICQRIEIVCMNFLLWPEVMINKLTLADKVKYMLSSRYQ